MASVALSPADAREALLALRLLSDAEADLDATRDEAALLRRDLGACRSAAPCPAAPQPEGWGERWLGRAGWLLSGVAIGMGVGLGMSLLASR